MNISSLESAQPIHLEPLVAQTINTISALELNRPGHYRRFLDPSREARPDGLNVYGVANAANLFYTLNVMPHDPDVRAGFLDAFAKLQDPGTGFFVDESLHTLHCTAHALAAIELFDAPSPYPVTGIEPYLTPAGIVGLLENLDWRGAPWSQSHQGAGAYAIGKLTHGFDRDADEIEWEDAYFAWLEARFDPATGLLHRGFLPGETEGSMPIHHHMAGTFHYFFNMEAARRPHPCPASLVDTCLGIERDGCPGLLDSIDFITADWVYCLTRSVRQSGHRFEESRSALWRVAQSYIRFLESVPRSTDAGFDDLHRLFGAWCALAELQTALPGLLRTRRPLRLVLDRRPFI